MVSNYAKLETENTVGRKMTEIIFQSQHETTTKFQSQKFKAQPTVASGTKLSRGLE